MSYMSVCERGMRTGKAFILIFTGLRVHRTRPASLVSFTNTRCGQVKVHLELCYR